MSRARTRAPRRATSWLARGAPLLLAAALAAGFARAGEDVLPAPLKARMEQIKVETIKKHEEFLTGEECAGRDTGQEGLTKARDYLVEQHTKYGLTGAGEGGSFLYDFEVPTRTWSDDDYVAVVRSGEPEVFVPGSDFVPVRNSASGKVDGEVVFAGYGIADAKESWDDFKGVDVKDKVVAVLLHEPRENKDGARFDGKEWTKEGAITRKWAAAQEKGAAAVLVFTDPDNHKELGALRGELPRYGEQRNAGGRPGPKIPVVHCSAAIGEKLFGAGKLLEWQRAIDSSLKPGPKKIDGVRVRLKVEVRELQAKVQDVVACKRGDDPKLAGEWIVVGAHYDHLGVDEYGRIYHGADDNGSGTSCLLAIAEAIGDPAVKFKRSILLIHFAGEEKGLLGSAAFCKKPLMPADQIVAMVNMDMVGRGRPHDIDAAGLKYSEEFAQLTRRALKLSRAKLAVGDGGMQYFERSDQYEFYKLGVPVLFFMEPKEHEDYHHVTDTMDKIVFPKIAETARLVTGLVHLLSEVEKRPKQEGINR